MFPSTSQIPRLDTEKFSSDLTGSWMRGRKQSARFWFSRRRKPFLGSKVSWVRARKNWYESTNMFWCLNGERQSADDQIYRAWISSLGRKEINNTINAHL